MLYTFIRAEERKRLSSLDRGWRKVVLVVCSMILTLQTRRRMGVVD